MERAITRSAMTGLIGAEGGYRQSSANGASLAIRTVNACTVATGSATIPSVINLSRIPTVADAGSPCRLASLILPLTRTCIQIMKVFPATAHGNAVSAISLAVSWPVLFALFALLVCILIALLIIFPLSIVPIPLLRLRRIDAQSRVALCLPHDHSAHETGKLRTRAPKASQQWPRSVESARPCFHLAPNSQPNALSVEWNLCATIV